MADTNPRTKIMQRILNLRARAEDDGSSEAEVMAALDRAAKLMDTYEVDEAELALAEGRGEIKVEIVTRTTQALRTNRNMPRVITALWGIDRFCGTKSCYWARTCKVEFTGDRADVEMAEYLLQLIHDALPRAYADWKRTQGAVGRGAKTSFESAMAMRIGHRLSDMARERDAEARRAEAAPAEIEDQGRQHLLPMIVEVRERKAKLTEEAFHKANPRLRSGRTLSHGSNGSAHSAGRAAGDRVNLGRPLGSRATASLTAR